MSSLARIALGALASFFIALWINITVDGHPLEGSMLFVGIYLLLWFVDEQVSRFDKKSS